MADKNPQILIDDGVLSHLFGNLSISYTALLDQTLKCLATIAADFPGRVIEATTPRIISTIALLLLSPVEDENVVFQAAVFLGNICAETTERKQMVIDAGVFHHMKVLLLMTAAFKFETVVAIYTIYYNLADGTQDQKQAVFDAELVEPVIRQMNSSDVELAKCATEAIGTLANGGTVQQKQRIIYLQALPIFVQLLTSEDEKLAQFAACGLQNISESKNDVDLTEQIQAIVDAGAIPPLKQLLISPITYISDEALNTFINITACDSTRCQNVLVAGILPLAKQLLRQPDLDRKMKVMTLLENATRYNINQVNMVLVAAVLSDIVKLIDDNGPALQKVS